MEIINNLRVMKIIFISCLWLTCHSQIAHTYAKCKLNVKIMCFTLSTLYLRTVKFDFEINDACITKIAFIIFTFYPNIIMHVHDVEFS